MPNRLAKAKEMGAAHVVNVAEKDMVKEILTLTDGRGCDLLIETSGNEKSIQGATECAKKGATIVLVGYNRSGDVQFPLSTAIDKELHIETIFRYRHIYPRAIEAVANGTVDVKQMITNIFEFGDIQNAMDESINNKANIVKSVVKIKQ